MVPRVVSIHAEESSFLWLLRDSAISAPHYALKDLAKLDGRVEAHLDGLRIAGEPGWAIVKEQLAAKEPGEFFVAAELAFESTDKAKIDFVLKLVADAPEGVRGVTSALGWLTFEQALPQIRMLLASQSPALRRIGIAASAIHRRDPGPVLRDVLGDPDPLLRARALRAVGELGKNDFTSQLRNSISDEHPSVRLAGAWSLALLTGDGAAIAALRSAAESPLPQAEKALHLAIRRMAAGAARAWQSSLARNPAQHRLAVQAAGHVGDPQLVPWLIERMSVPLLARVAGEAFTMITGVDLAYHDLEKDAPEGFEAGPTENPEDEDVAMDPDENLPWPDPKLIIKWWDSHRGEFQPRQRYLVGKPIAPDWLQEVLRAGMQRQRAAAALEIAIRNPGQPLYEVRAPGFRQIANFK